MKRITWLFLVAIILAISLYLLIWGFWPPRREIISFPLLPVEGMPSLPGERWIRLEFSPEMRLGETQILELQVIKESDQGDISLYTEYNVIVESRLDLPSADVRPEGLAATALVEEANVTFYWEIQPLQAGDLRGTVWLYLHLITKEGGQELRQPVSAQMVEINSKSLVGWSGSDARVVGVGGMVLGLGSGLLIFGRRQGKKP